VSGGIVPWSGDNRPLVGGQTPVRETPDIPLIDRCEKVIYYIYMKKAVFFTLIFWLLFFSCENLVTDLPSTKTADYISGDTVVFPRGTKAIDVYNTVVSIFTAENEYHVITNGSWKRIKTTTVDGLPRQEWETVTFNKIKHTHSIREPEINTHTVYLYDNDLLTKEVVFEWQRQTTNVWKNESIEGDITFKF